MGARILAALALSLAAGFSVSGQAWERLGPPGGMVISMAAAADRTVYLGTPDGHIFASTKRGERWELRGRAGGRLDGVVQRLVPDARNGNRVLAAIWFRGSENGGVFESADGARSWKAAGLGEEAVRALAQSPSEPRVWVAGTRRGVFRSDDDAQSWQRISSADDPELQNVDSLAIDPVDARTIYVGTYHLPWKTTDGGKTWKAISTGMIDDSDVMSLRIDARDPKRIFSSACSGIYRSDDKGESWIKLQGIPYSSRRTQEIVQDPSDVRVWYAATTEGLWTTTDYGETWKRITGRETDANAIVVLPGERSKRILAGMSAEGVLRSDDEGNSFAESNNGFLHRVIVSLAVSAGKPSQILVGAEGYGDGLLLSDNDGQSWAELRAEGPKQSVERIFSFSGEWWATFAEGGMARFDGVRRIWRSVQFREAAPRKQRRAPNRRPQMRTVKTRVKAFVQTSNGVSFAAGDGLWQLDRNQREFRRVAGMNKLPLSFSYLSATTSGSLLAIAGGELWSQSPGSEWKRIPTGPADGNELLWVTENPAAETQLLVGTQRGVFLRRANGEWRLVSNGLPAIASLAPAFSDGFCLMAMSNGGLYASSDGLTTWQRVDTDAERGAVGKIVATERGGFLVGSEQEGMLFRSSRNRQ